MLNIQDYLKTHDIKTDELGRIIIDDLDFLKKINGGISDISSIVVSDGACGNTNCLC